MEFLMYIIIGKKDKLMAIRNMSSVLATRISIILISFALIMNV